jgi:hypothetical protein
MVARAKEIDRKFPAVLGDFLSLGDLGLSISRVPVEHGLGSGKAPLLVVGPGSRAK